MYVCMYVCMYVGALTSCVYTFGFILMCPQLYINHKLKSVSHLPWNVSDLFFLDIFILVFTTRNRFFFFLYS